MNLVWFHLGFGKWCYLSLTHCRHLFTFLLTHLIANLLSLILAQPGGQAALADAVFWVFQAAFFRLVEVAGNGEVTLIGGGPNGANGLGQW